MPHQILPITIRYQETIIIITNNENKSVRDRMRAALAVATHLCSENYFYTIHMCILQCTLYRRMNVLGARMRVSQTIAQSERERENERQRKRREKESEIVDMSTDYKLTIFINFIIFHLISKYVFERRQTQRVMSQAAAERQEIFSNKKKIIIIKKLQQQQQPHNNNNDDSERYREKIAHTHNDGER